MDEDNIKVNSRNFKYLTISESGEQILCSIFKEYLNNRINKVVLTYDKLENNICCLKMDENSIWNGISFHPSNSNNLILNMNHKLILQLNQDILIKKNINEYIELIYQISLLSAGYRVDNPEIIISGLLKSMSF